MKGLLATVAERTASWVLPALARTAFLNPSAVSLSWDISLVTAALSDGGAILFPSIVASIWRNRNKDQSVPRISTKASPILTNRGNLSPSAISLHRSCAEPSQESWEAT